MADDVLVFVFLCLYLYYIITVIAMRCNNFPNHVFCASGEITKELLVVSMAEMKGGDKRRVTHPNSCSVSGARAVRRGEEGRTGETGVSVDGLRFHS